MGLFRASSLCQAVRCPLDLATDGILQLGPVSIPSQHRLRSPEHPPATIAHRLSRELPAQKPSERLYKGTQRWGLGLGGGKGRVNGQAIAICLSSSIFGGFFCFGFLGSSLHRNDLHHIFLPSSFFFLLKKKNSVPSSGGGD